MAEVFRKKFWTVQDVSMECLKRCVQEWHYSKGGSNTATYRHGLFLKGQEHLEDMCYGIAWWIPPTKTAASYACRENWKGVLCLSRLCIDPDVPKNAASYLIRSSMRMIDRERWPTLVTYADSWRGHDGIIYKASGWEPFGETKPERRYLIDGKLVNRKAGPITRTHQQMLDLGAEMIGSYSAKRFIHRQDTDKVRKSVGL